jgi:uncharacterized damage-inducible protein DinB
VNGPLLVYHPNPEVLMRSAVLAMMLGLVNAGVAAAQQPAGDDAVTALRKSYAEVTGLLTRAADLVPADKYGYRPVATVRTFAQLIGHLADAHNYYCAVAAGRKLEWSDPIERGISDKATLVKKLKESIDGCAAVYRGSGQAGALVENVAHTNHHYGNIVTYVRILGLVPPQS